MDRADRRTLLWLGAALVLAIVASLVAGGCSAGGAAAPGPGPDPVATGTPPPSPDPDRTGTPAPSPDPPGTGTPTPAPDPALAGSWSGAFTVELPGGWAVTGCDGDRRDLCVHRDGRLAGDVELLDYPLDGPEGGDEPAAVAAARARAFLEDFRRDRAAGCPGFGFTDELVPATVGGQPASRAGFTLRDAGGEVVERVVNYFAVHDGTLWIVNVDAYVTDGGCLGPSEFDPSFLPGDLADFEPYLDGLVAATPFPAAPAP